jgi:hypothetical protein
MTEIVNGVKTRFIKAHDGSVIRSYTINKDLAFVFSTNDIYIREGHGMKAKFVELDADSIANLVVALKNEGMA